MRRQHNGRDIRDGALEVRDDIARVSAECLARSVLVNLRRTEVTQTLRQQIGDLTLVKCGAADGNQLEKFVQYTLFVNHGCLLSEEENNHKGNRGEQHRERVAL